LLIAAVAATLALSACGGSTATKTAGGEVTTTTLAPTTTTTAPTTTTTAPTTTTTKPAITKAAYVTQANTICKVMNDKTAALADPGEDLAKMAVMFDQTKQLVVDALVQLRALPTPAGQAAAIEAIWTKVDKLVGDIDHAVAALKAGDLDKFTALATQLDKDTVAANTASNAYGLTVCGS
jgi:hypothetical protein